MDRFEHLGFLIQFGDKGSEGNSLSQSSPFFANSDPDMPVVPVPVAQVHHWVLHNIVVALEYISERTSSKENGPASASDQDVAMTDACTTSVNKVSTSTRSASFIEGTSKSSYVKHASDIKGSSVKVLNSHGSAIYILAPLRYATVYGCSDATIACNMLWLKFDNLLYKGYDMAFWYGRPWCPQMLMAPNALMAQMTENSLRQTHRSGFN